MHLAIINSDCEFYCPLSMNHWSMDLGAHKVAGAAQQGVVRWVEGLAYMACRKLCNFGCVKFAK